MDVSVLTGLYSSLTRIASKISHKNNIKETSSVSILRKDPIQETLTTGKRSQGDYLMHKKIQHKMSWPFQQKVDYEGDTDEKNNNTDE